MDHNQNRLGNLVYDQNPRVITYLWLDFDGWVIKIANGSQIGYDK
jgi:hypothetical protein